MPAKTYKQILENEETYSKLGCPQTVMSSEDEGIVMRYVNDHPNDPDVRRLNNMIAAKNYGEFEKLPYGLINYQATREARNFLNVSQNMDHESPEVKKLISEKLHDPFFRIALDIYANTPDTDRETRENCRAISTAMTETIMENTLSPIDSEGLANLSGNGKNAEQIESLVGSDAKTQMTIAKTLLLSHLGSLQIKQNDGRVSEYSGSVSDIFARGTRTIYSFKKGVPGDDTIENMVFRDRYVSDGSVVDNGTSVESRIFASHGVSVNADSDGPASYKEKSSIFRPTYWRDNFCMNPAIGGLGKKHGSKMIDADGKNGHVYIKKVESTDRKNGYLMVGFESEAPGMVGATGHKHNWRAKPSKVSSFGLTKGAPGVKKGGRLVDLSVYDHSVVSSLLLAFDEKYRSLKNTVNEYVCRGAGHVRQEEPENIKEARRQISKINKKLCGRVMGPDELVSFIKDDLGIDRISVKGENGRTKEMTVEAVAAIKKERGCVNFNRMNAALAKNDIAAANELEKALKATPYGTEKAFDRYVKALDKAKRKTLGIKRKDSPKMKNVKAALSRMAELSMRKDANALEAKKACDELKAAADAYLGDPKKAKNERYELVRRIRLLLDSDIKGVEKTTERVKSGIARANENKNQNVIDSFKAVDIDGAKAEKRKTMSKIAHDNFEKLRAVSIDAARALFDKCGGSERFKCGDELRDIVSFNIVKDAFSDPNESVTSLLERPDFMKNYRAFFSCKVLDTYAEEVHSPKTVRSILHNDVSRDPASGQNVGKLDYIVAHAKKELARRLADNVNSVLEGGKVIGENNAAEAAFSK